MAKKKELQKKIEELQELKIDVDKRKREVKQEAETKEAPASKPEKKSQPKAEKEPIPKAEPIPDDIANEMIESLDSSMEPEAVEEPEEPEEPETDEASETDEESCFYEGENELDFDLEIGEQAEQARKQVARVKPVAFDGFHEDGPHKAYKYWNYKGRFWTLTEDFWFASEHGLWRPVWVWYKNGEIHHLMTEEEKQMYLP